MINEILECFPDEVIIKADGFDEAIIGIDEPSMRLVYSVSKCIDILLKDMNYEDAMEHFSFNVSGAYVGEKTPIWCLDSFEAISKQGGMYNDNDMTEFNEFSIGLLHKEINGIKYYDYNADWITTKELLKIWQDKKNNKL